MKVVIDENENYKEDAVKIQCICKTSRIQQLASIIQQFDMRIKAQLDDRVVLVDVNAILYAESVDRKTFLYAEKEVYCFKGSLSALEKKLKKTSFLRISKTTILNIRYLNHVKPYVNHRLKATLSNGESLIISRSYIQDLKEYLINSEV